MALFMVYGMKVYTPIVQCDAIIFMVWYGNWLVCTVPDYVICSTTHRYERVWFHTYIHSYSHLFLSSTPYLLI